MCAYLGGWTPHEKTVSFQFLDDDGRYAHAPPRWPHDEYMLQFGHPFVPQDFGLKNGSDAANVGISNALSETNNFESNRAHEWQKLRPYPSKGHFIGPGFYDGSTSSLAYNPPPPYNTHQAITDSTITTSSASASSSGVDSGDGQIPNAVSESATHGKLFPGAYGGSPYGSISTTVTKSVIIADNHPMYYDFFCRLLPKKEVALKVASGADCCSDRRICCVSSIF